MSAGDDEDDEEGGAVAKATDGRGTIGLRPSQLTMGYIKDLIELGTHGNTAKAVASRLIDEGIRRAIKDRLIEKRRAP